MVPAGATGDSESAALVVLGADPPATALLLDFDGSLAPIVEHPDDARPLPAAAGVLGRLAGGLGRVAIVSGRPVAFLARHLPVPGVELAGIYGFEHWADGEARVDERVAPWAPAVEAAAAAAETRLPGVLVERKGGVSVTLHWRLTPDREAEVRAVARDLATRFGLEAPQRARAAVELRPPVPIDKGTAVCSLLAGFDRAGFAGDDVGDLPAFDALDALAAAGDLSHAVRIGVTSAEAPPEVLARADVVVDGPAGLLGLLAALAERIGA